MINSFTGENHFLSNFYVRGFWYKRNYAMTAEHHYQAAKAAFASDAHEIRNCLTPGNAKRMGKQIATDPPKPCLPNASAQPTPTF